MSVNGQPPLLFNNADALANAVIERVGKRIVLGLPLGLGKANHLVNALFQSALNDPSISLTIFTALTLEAPSAGSDLARRFLEPMQDRFFSGYPRLDYARALSEGNLPDNIRVHEFFLQPGQWLGNAQAQQDYVSINYTDALRSLLDAGVNVIGQLVSTVTEHHHGEIATRYNLSCNPDITADLLDLRRQGKLHCLAVGQINPHLPLMCGAADRPADDFDFILDHESYYFPLFMPPQKPVSLIDHAIGLQVARLIPDGGTLQIGIGSLGDAVAHGLILRHKHNPLFRSCLRNLLFHHPGLTSQEDSFTAGLYGLSEMLTEGLLALVNAGVIKREVDNRIVHAGFFVGSPNFYRMLADMTEETRHKIAMMPISFINELYGQEKEKRRARLHARFVNSGIMATLTGAIVSDGLEDAQVISGVGGQHNFVSQASALSDARSIITLRATRMHQGKVESTICWSYGHITIPRHLRDIVITEYGIADLRGKSDAQVIAALLNIADSRFQNALLQKAKQAGKIDTNYEIPDIYRDNSPERIIRALSQAYQQGYLDAFPLGSDFTPTEQQLALALESLSEHAGSFVGLLRLFIKGMACKSTTTMTTCLDRMQLTHTSSLRVLGYRYLVLGALLHTHSQH